MSDLCWEGAVTVRLAGFIYTPKRIRRLCIGISVAGISCIYKLSINITYTISSHYSLVKTLLVCVCFEICIRFIFHYLSLTIWVKKIVYVNHRLCLVFVTVCLLRSHSDTNDPVCATWFKGPCTVHLETLSLAMIWCWERSSKLGITMWLLTLSLSSGDISHTVTMPLCEQWSAGNLL